LNGQSMTLSSDKLGNCLTLSTSDQEVMAVLDRFNLCSFNLPDGTLRVTIGQSARLRDFRLRKGRY
jgi:hypothetical protein